MIILKNPSPTTVETMIHEIYVRKYAEEHKQSCKKWTHGGIKRIFFDEEAEAFAIEYEDSKIWHYKRDNFDDHLIWW